MKCGLLGRKLSHSYSPQIHNHLADYSYELFEVEPEALELFLKEGCFDGLNVTIPYKKAVIPFCSDLTETAKKLGAVNTIIRCNDGRLIGHNSDYFGFSSMLQRSGLQVYGKKVLVLGSGGASATVCAVLEESGANVIVISRSGENHYGNLCKHADAAVIVNTTPVGMYPHTGETPLNIEHFPALEGVLDIIYNPARTQLLMNAEKRDLVAMNGLWMLVAQAKESAQWFLNTTIADEEICKIHKLLRNQMENIILIGMPGCGKTTIGNMLADSLGKTFVDADVLVEEYAGRTIPQIFTDFGEAGFRQLETDVLRKVGRQSGLVIATGGGCVTIPENYDLLHQNGKIFWLIRDISLLPTNGRPLSQSGKLDQMYSVRKPLYASFADYTIENHTSLEKTLSEILDLEGTL